MASSKHEVFTTSTKTLETVQCQYWMRISQLKSTTNIMSMVKQTTLGSSSFINDNTYTGAVYEGNNIFYMNARFYDANNGRFLTQEYI